MGNNILRMPDRVRLANDQAKERETVPGVDGLSSFGGGTVKLTMCGDVLEAFLQADGEAVSEVVLCWDGLMADAGVLLADHWERGYGDLAWKDRDEVSVMPWYFLDDRGRACLGFGVKVRPSAMCRWEADGPDLLLHLDVRCGGAGVLLQGRCLKMAEIIMRRYEGTDAFSAAKQFCRCMCEDPLRSPAPVYGSNNWYYAYGESSREDILRDARYLADMTEGNENRPFMVIDDGWETAHRPPYNGGPFFVSVKPGTLAPDQEARLREAYRRASGNTVEAVPLDWKEGPLPARWSTCEGIKEYNWE